MYYASRALFPRDRLQLYSQQRSSFPYFSITDPHLLELFSISQAISRHFASFTRGNDSQCSFLTMKRLTASATYNAYWNRAFITLSLPLHLSRLYSLNFINLPTYRSRISTLHVTWKSFECFHRILRNISSVQSTRISYNLLVCIFFLFSFLLKLRDKARAINFFHRILFALSVFIATNLIFLARYRQSEVVIKRVKKRVPLFGAPSHRGADCSRFTIEWNCSFEHGWLHKERTK